MLDPVIEKALLSDIIAHIRFGKSRMLLYNPVIVFFLIITL